jgi:hypothetical protein
VIDWLNPVWWAPPAIIQAAAAVFKSGLGIHKARAIGNLGSAIPIKFSLGGDKGLNIFAAGYPISQLIVCGSGAPQDDLEQTVTAGSSSLKYDPLTDQYIFVWKTDKAWTGTCRQLVVVLIDGTTHIANFKFK